MAEKYTIVLFLTIVFLTVLLVGGVMMVGGFTLGIITYILHPREKSKNIWFGISIKGFIVIVVAVLVWLSLLGIGYMTGYVVLLKPVGSNHYDLLR